jgi:hypothetical protein
MKPRLKKIEEFETDTHRIVILGDTATNGKEYAEAHVTPKDKKK